MTWRERIQAAREREVRWLGMQVRGARFTGEDRWMASKWWCCAVGEQAEKGVVFPVTVVLDDPVPADPILYENGLRFFEAIKAHKPDVAERLLDRIEDRALQLKREAGSSNAPASVESDETAPAPFATYSRRAGA